MAWLKKIARQVGLRGLSTLVATLLAIPFAWGSLTGLYAWLSPFIMLNSVFVLKSFVWFNGLAFLILIVIFLRKRWFCRQLCPVGWGCDRISSCSRRKRFSVKKIPSVGRWLAVSSLVAAWFGVPLFILLDPMSIFNGFFAVFSGEVSVAAIISFVGLPFLLAIHLIFPGIWCAKLCPLGGLQDELAKIKSLISTSLEKKGNARLETNTRRRFFLASGIGLITGLMLPRFLHSEKKGYFRPPGAVSPELFNVLCLRCGSCIKACPTNILIHHENPEDLLTWMVPEIHFEKGYCLENCNLCSRVCSSGAITLFSPEAKAQLPIGLAKVKPENCLLAKHTECDRCKTACPYEAIKIEAGEANLSMLPVVNPDKCVGCGACAVICPQETIEMLALAT